ncbi:protein ecdysoneless [Onthophagus taurus]|uniref:protein ecdysoneless n=1 Tax=Onthophagus taurus TaxID=166361 RepID=UPI000C207CDF|nr:protein ecdysoneless [Onthophagus taurus]XP_022921278.1 protein ecdysoneless [Onthophagus taurus]
MNGNVLKTVREDDFVEYFLFPLESFCEDECKRKLKSVMDNVNKLIKEYMSEYIWHRDTFNLTIKSFESVNKDHLPPHLHGVLHYGDNIEDEWFVVYLLKQITKEIDGLVARIIDTDGEFLLIEAANCLPSWANPDTCDNRVFIYKGVLHIIPPETKNNDTFSINTALDLIKSKPSLTVASQDIQNCINRKTECYPIKIKENLHHVNVYLPIGVAALLNENPQLIASAVTSFCNRDSIDVKYCRAMKYFPPEVRVLSHVTFTKCLYAMLINSKYQPDRKTGWNLPPINSEEYKQQSLGVKLACGFEILVSQARGGEVENDKAFVKYIEKLNEKGYFKNLLEHSKEYNDLLNKAKNYYKNINKSSSGSNNLNNLGKEILNSLKQLNINYDYFKEQEKSLPPNDDESWLNILPEELDKMLEDQYGKNSIFKLNKDTDPTKFTETLDSFLNHVSDLEGAEFPLGTLPTRPPRTKKPNKVVSFSNQNDPTPTNNRVNFDPSSFACAVQDILNFVIPEDDSWESSSDSDMSDYGKDEENLVGGGMTEMRRLMDEMDKELSKTTIGESFKNKEESFEDIETFKPVDIDVNALKNILESYRSQMGEAGPSSNMLGPMGVQLDEVD